MVPRGSSWAKFEHHEVLPMNRLSGTPLGVALGNASGVAKAPGIFTFFLARAAGHGTVFWIALLFLLLSGIGKESRRLALKRVGADCPSRSDDAWSPRFFDRP